MARLIISKQELQILFSPGEKPISRYKLRTYFLTNELLSLLGMTEKEYNRRKVFTPKETAIILATHQITKEEIDAIFSKKV